jgi:hypothetical protein
MDLPEPVSQLAFTQFTSTDFSEHSTSRLTGLEYEGQTRDQTCRRTIHAIMLCN